MHLAAKMSEKFRQISEFLGSNGLKLNEEKTHILLLTSSQRRRIHSPGISLVTPSATVHSTAAENLLGCTIHQDLKWSEYILLGKTSLVKSLATRLNALDIICKVATFKTRKLVAEGKLIYTIQVWGGCDQYLIKTV